MGAGVVEGGRRLNRGGGEERFARSVQPTGIGINRTEVHNMHDNGNGCGSGNRGNVCRRTVSVTDAR